MENNKVKAKMDEIWRRLNTEPDFVCLPRYGGSLKRVLARYPDGAPDKVVADAMQISVSDLQRLLATAVQKLRAQFDAPDC